MRVVVRLLLGLVALIRLGGSAANAASAKEVFEKYDLIGIFSIDCTKPVSSQNHYWVFRALGENVQRDEMSSPTTRSRAGIVDSATALGPNEIAQSYLSERNIRWNEVLRMERGRLRTWESQVEGRPKLISGGRFTDDQNETPWRNKCP